MAVFRLSRKFIMSFHAFHNPILDLTGRHDSLLTETYMHTHESQEYLFLQLAPTLRESEFWNLDVLELPSLRKLNYYG